MAGSKSRQAPKQGQRVLVEELPASFETQLTQDGVYTQITDGTTGAVVEVPTTSMQVVRTVLAAFLPEGGVARGINPTAAAAPAPAPVAEPVAEPPVAAEEPKPAAKTKIAKSKAPAAKAPAAKAAPSKPAEKPSPAAKQAKGPEADFSSEPWFAELPDEVEAGSRIILRKALVAVDEKKHDRVVGLASDNPGNPSLPAYAINITGAKGASGEINVGFVLAMSETKFVIVSPQLGPKTSHRGIRPTAQRLEILLETTTDQSLKAA